MEYKIIKIKRNDNMFPKKLIDTKKKVEQIYVIGNINLLKNRSVAIVGSRDVTEYGRKYARIISSELAKHGVTVVSGLAIGVDSVAHSNALLEKGNTIAVLGSGFNNIYPKENKELFENIIENGGLVISEYEPKKEVDLKNYPLRNRIISGLSEFVIVVEAKVRSGSGITARHAWKQGKRVYCLPGRIEDKNSKGTNELIKNGANIITCVNDVLEVVYEEEKTNSNLIKEEYKDMYDLIKVSPINIEELAIKLNMKMADLNVKITMMELEGLIENGAGNFIKIKE